MTEENLTYKIITNEFKINNFKPLKHLTIHDKDFIIESAKKFRLKVSYINKELYDDFEIASIIVKYDDKSYKDMPDKFKNDKSFALLFINNNRCNYNSLDNVVEVIPDSLYEDDNFTKEALQLWIKHSYSSRLLKLFNRFNYSLKIINMFCDIAIENNSYHLFSIYKKLINKFKNNEVIYIKIAKVSGFSIIYMSSEMRYNKNIIMAAVSNEPMALKYAHHSLQNDEEVVRIAVSQCGWSLRYASRRLRNNYNVVMDAVINEPLERFETSRRIKSIKYELFKEGFAQYKLSTHISLKYASRRLRKNKSIKAAIERYPMAIKEADDYTFKTSNRLYIIKIMICIVYILDLIVVKNHIN